MCPSLLSELQMTDTHVCVSAQLPHPFQPNVFVQMFWQEQRQPGLKETSAPPPPGSVPCGSQTRPRQRCPPLMLLRGLSPAGRLLAPAPDAAARDGVLHPTMTTITRAMAPAGSGFSRRGSRAALSHRRRQMTECRQPRQ